MTQRLTYLDGDNWEEFMEGERVVLTLGKTDCAACHDFEGELKDFLAEDDEWTDVRFGKIVLDQRGLLGFKKANPWLAEVDALPYTVIFADGDQQKAFAGGGINRLVKRMSKTLR